MYMRHRMLVFSLVVLFHSSVYAQTKIEDKSSVQALVAKVKNAPPSERRVLMNALKIKLRSMQQETRTHVMLGLRRAFNTQQAQMHTQQMHTNMHQQNTMGMSESKHMQEHMMKGGMTSGERPPIKGQVPTSMTPPKSTASTPRGQMPMNGM